MSTNKKYYWLKLKEDFFEEDAISWLEEQENGKEYCLFYLKLCLKSLKNNGCLIRQVGTMLVPYDERYLAKITNTDFDTVVVAMQLLKRIGLIQVLENGELYMTQLEKMVGSETNKAEKMRALRDKRKNELEKGNNVTQMLPKCYPEIEIEIEKEKDIYISSKEKTNKAFNEELPYQEIYDHWLSKGLYQHIKLSDTIKEAIEFAMTKKNKNKKVLYTLEEIKEAIDNYKEIYESKFFYDNTFTLNAFLKQSNGLPMFIGEGERVVSYKMWLLKEKDFNPEASAIASTSTEDDTSSVSFNGLSVEDTFKLLKDLKK